MRAFTVCACLLFVACSADRRASATLKTSAGKEAGVATLIERPDGVIVGVVVNGLPPGRHGMHIHENAKCEPPLFESAGGHFNPGQQSHDHQHPAGHHAGDLPNLEIGPDGSGKASAMISGVTLRGNGHHSLFHKGGTSIVIHEAEDDLRRASSGGSGKRIACGVIR